MEPGKPLETEALRRHCDPEGLGFDTTEELEDLTELVGQERAAEAGELALAIERDGYNLFVTGPEGTGRHAFIRDLVTRMAATRAQGSDWCYLNNLDDPNRPIAVELPAGEGVKLRDDLRHLIEEARSAIPAAFESEEYRTRRQAAESEFQEQQEEVFTEIRKRARDRGLALLRTPAGFAFAPLRNGEVLDPQEFQKLPPEERERIQQTVKELEQELQQAMGELPKRFRETRDKIQELGREVALFAIGSLVDELTRKYDRFPRVVAYLERMRRDVADNLELFGPEAAQAENALSRQVGEPLVLRRYGVNLLVDRSGAEGAPVVFEDHPTYKSLVGEVEHFAHMGALLTDFQMIKPGALHRANHGYLILDARKMLLHPFAWEGIKETLRRGEIRIRSLGDVYGFASTVSLEPEPIPLRVKVVLVGSRMLHALINELDPECPELFKITADFDDEMERDTGNDRRFARLLATFARREELRPLDRSAVARILEEGSRLSGDAGKLSARVQRLFDVVREADHRARQEGSDRIRQEDVRHAIEARIRRASRIRDRIHEEIQRGTILIDTEGAATGQVNGLAVHVIGDVAFGKPSRITAGIRLGSGKVVDIEREVKLGGPIHSKGVLILSGFLASRYALDRPFSLSATLVFEQSYGGVEGDSASAAELFALLSALADVPLKQSFAVTGSVNQRGEVQAVGGINEKIEGFFDVCNARGLSGEQGVLIPATNVKHLMLREDVVEACHEGRFRVVPIDTIDRGIELLTGRAAGERDASGNFPQGTINQLVEARLVDFAEKIRAFSKPTKAEDRS